MIYLHRQKLLQLAEKNGYDQVILFEKLPQSGSNRIYFRLTLKDQNSIIGVFNDNKKENESFFYFTHFFNSKNIAVPTLIAIDNDRLYYLLEDLGDDSLFSILSRFRKENHFPEEILPLYRQVIRILPKIQLAGKENMDFSFCYPREAFDRQSIQWDLNYFKYCFLKLVYIPFDEQLLEDDFNQLILYLLEPDSSFFMFRDFQSRNIMIRDEKVYFIDYQGGRKGALHYDLASLLYDGKADIPPEIRDLLLEEYLDELEKYISVDRKEFKSYFDAFVLIRILQALGTYGYRGYYEKKSHFLLSIPYAIKNINYLLRESRIAIDLPMLMAVLTKMTETDIVKMTQPKDKLTISIHSFSYKKGIPQDYTANGGGFVFDCRSLPNPGRDKAFSSLTGMDNEVIEYLEKYEEISYFSKHVFAIIEASIENYLDRNFTHLMVNFGCTGGQHRSVYFAEKLAQYIKEKYVSKVDIILKHTNLSK